jgi:hypothetical protein
VVLVIRLQWFDGVKIGPNPLFIPPFRPVVGELSSTSPFFGRLFSSEMLNRRLSFVNRLFVSFRFSRGKMLKIPVRLIGHGDAGHRDALPTGTPSGRCIPSTGLRASPMRRGRSRGTGKALRHDAERPRWDYDVERRNQENQEKGIEGMDRDVERRNQEKMGSWCFPCRIPVSTPDI